MLEFLASIDWLKLVISVLTLTFAVVGIQFKDMKIIIVSQLLSNGLLAAQCIIGGTISSGGVVILATVQTMISFVFAYKKIKFPTWLTCVFILGFTAITVVGLIVPSIPTTYFDLITMVAAWFFAIAMVQEKSWLCRIFSTANLLLWLIYDIIVLPYNIITHVVIIVFNIIAIIRNDRKEWKALLNTLFGKKADNSIPAESEEEREELPEEEKA